MKVREIMRIIDNFAPVELAVDYDNVGLIIGDASQEVTAITVCVDVTRAVIVDAIKNNVNLIIAHHPIIFTAKKKLIIGDYVSELVMMCIANGINVFAAHTNMDRVSGGINDALAESFGGYNLRLLDKDGCGTIGDVDEIMITDFMEIITSQIDGDIQIFGESDDRLISTFAVCGGAGGRDDKLPNICVTENIDIIITSELKHSLILEYVDRNIIVIECNHYESEKVFINIVVNLLASNDIKVIEYY